MSTLLIGYDVAGHSMAGHVKIELNFILRDSTGSAPCRCLKRQARSP